MNKRNWLIVLVIILVAVGIYNSGILMIGPAVKEMSAEDCEEAERDCIDQVNKDRVACGKWIFVPEGESAKQRCAELYPYDCDLCDEKTEGNVAERVLK